MSKKPVLKPPANAGAGGAGGGAAGPSARPVGATMKPGALGSTWVCLRCTYKNSSKNKACEMCAANRPPPPTSMVVHVAVSDPNGGDDKTVVFDSLKPSSSFGYMKDILENKTAIAFADQQIYHDGVQLNHKDDAKLCDIIFIDPREIVTFRLRSKKAVAKKPAASSPSAAAAAASAASAGPAPPGGIKPAAAAGGNFDDDLARALAASMADVAPPAPTPAATPSKPPAPVAAPASSAAPASASASASASVSGKGDSKSDSKSDSKAVGAAADDDWGKGDHEHEHGDDWGTGAGGADDGWGAGHDKSHAPASASGSGTGDDGDEKGAVEARSTTILNMADVEARQLLRADEVKDVLGLSPAECVVALRHFRWQKQALLDAWIKDASATRIAAGLGPKPTAPATATATAAVSATAVGGPGGAAAAAKEKEPTEMDCYLCGSDGVPIEKSTALACGHRFCDGCWSNWVKAEFDKGPTCIFTKCMEAKCKARVPDSVQLKLLPKEKAVKYRSYLLTNFVEGSRTIKFCPTANCEQAAEVLESHTSQINGPIGLGVECKCGSGWCWKCKRDDHRPSTCEQCEQWTAKNSSDSENALWILANTKICPKCKVHIEKNQGCNHMTCKNCKHEFCWLCKGNWVGHSTCALYDFSTGVPKAGTKMSKEESAAAEAKNSLQKYLHYFNRFDNHAKSIKFAEKTRLEAEIRMQRLQSMKGVGAQAVSFLMDSVNSIIRCRRVLQWTYVYAFYLPEPKGDRGPRVLFESQQQKLEELTDRLHGLSEKPLDSLMNNRMRTDIISLTRSTEKYRKNLVAAVHNILVGSASA